MSHTVQRDFKADVAPEDGVLVARHLFNKCLCALLLPVHDQRQAQRHSTDNLHPKIPFIRQDALTSEWLDKSQQHTKDRAATA